MNDDRRRFDPAELDGADDPRAAELLTTARDLEAYARTGTAAASVEFEDRVMRTIAAEPAPRLGASGGLVAAIGDAWRIAWSGSWPLAMRGQAIGLLLMVAVGIGSLGSVAAVGAARLLSPDGPAPSDAPIATPSPTPSPTSTPTPSAEPSPSPSPSASPTPTETAEPSGTDDRGGSSGSGSSGGGGSGSGRSDRTPRPTETPGDDESPDPAETPDPGDTPKPTDDSSGHG